jgi:alpha-ketoglutarate-dependent sulfate ester dioxygenase
MTTQLEAPEITVTKAGGAIGAVIGNVRLSGELPEQTGDAEHFSSVDN